jgi:hypothetical protein
MKPTQDQIVALLKKHAGNYGDKTYTPAYWVVEAMQELAELVTNSDKQKVENPYLGTGVPFENWQRGYEGIRFIGYPNSDAHKFYLEGKALKQSREWN